MQTRSRQPRLAREGQGPTPRTRRNTPPRTRTLAHPRPRRDWTETNRRLIERGNIELWIDTRELDQPRGHTRGRPYADAIITAAVVISVLYHLPLRQTQGNLAHLMARLAPDAPVPSFATLCRRRRTLDWDPPRLAAGCVLAIDATGVTCYSAGEWLRDKHRDLRRASFVKLHVGVDAATGEVRSFEVTASTGRGSGDASVGPELIDAAAQRGGVSAVLADRAYDTRRCYEAADRGGGRLVTPPKDNATRGLHPHRDEHLAQIGQLGPPGWKRRVGYGQRAQVESFFGCYKRVFTGRVRARSLEGARAELAGRVAVWNMWVTRPV